MTVRVHFGSPLSAGNPPLQRQLRGDLDWITMRALEKDRSRRYGSPMDLAADIDRYLKHEPVLASPPSAAYRVRKFVRRHTAGVAAGTVLLLGLTAGIAGSTVGLIQARRSEARALEEAQRSERVTQFLQDMLTGVSPDRMGAILLADLKRQAGDAREGLGDGDDELVSLDDALVGIYMSDAGIRLLDEEILIPATERIDESLEDDPVIAGQLHHTIGEVYRKLGRSKTAVGALERALELRRQSLGEDHPDTLRTMLKLALVYFIVDRKDEHLQLASEVAERGRRVLGDEHQLTLDALGEVADAYLYGDDPAKAKEGQDRHFELLEVERRALGEDHRQTLYRMDKVAQILQGRGNLEEAEHLFRETLETKTRVLGEEDPSTLGTRFNLALNQSMQGLYDEAETVYRETLEIGRHRFGESSDFSRFPMVNLTELCNLQGRYAEAATWSRRLLDINRRLHGKRSPQTLSSMMALAGSLKRHGDYSAAESLYRDVLEMARRNDDAYREAYSHLGLAGLHLRQGDRVQADSHFKPVVEFLERNGASLDHPNLASYHVLAGNLDAALKSLKKAVERGDPLAWIATNPDFLPLHGNPEFEAIVVEAKQRIAGE